MKKILITGANRGIGLQLAKRFQASGYKVFATCRTASEELKQLDIAFIENFDVFESDVDERLKELLGSEKIDALINNAGIMLKGSLDEWTEENILKQIKINSLGPLRVTRGALSFFSDQAKIAVITSRMGSIADNTSGGAYGYRMSKAAVNAAFMSLSHDLKDRNIAVGIFHPGWVQTDMTGNSGPMTTEESANNLFQRFEELNLENSGTFWHSNGEILPW